MRCEQSSYGTWGYEWERSVLFLVVPNAVVFGPDSE